MSEFEISEYTEYDAFAREWHVDEFADHDVSLDRAREQGLISEDETRMLWQVLGELAADEVLIQLPEWLADEKVGVVDGATPTLFVGQIDRETEKAIRVGESAAARPLMKRANRIHHLREGVERVTGSDEPRREQLEQRLTKTRREFERRDDVVGLADEWLPKSQLRYAAQRRSRVYRSADSRE